MPPVSMDDVFDPEDHVSTADWFSVIGTASSNELNWNTFRMNIVQCTAASSVGLLRKARDIDIDTAVTTAKLGVGYKDALCEYLTAKGSLPFVFRPPGDGAARATSTAYAPASALSQKKFDSQKNRPPLGRELGPDQLSKLEFPDNLFQTITCSKQTAMPSRGKNSTEEVADLVWQWIFTKYGSIHVDAAFCEKVEELLSELWPKLKPWGKKDRSWAQIIANRFTNARSSLCESSNEKDYKKMFAIPQVDLTSPAKKLVGDLGRIDVQADKRSLLDLSPRAAAARADGEAKEPLVTVAQGVPVLGACSGHNLNGINSCGFQPAGGGTTAQTHAAADRGAVESATAGQPANRPGTLSQT